MFKFRSYNVKKATEKNEKEQPTSSTKTPSYSAMTLKKPPKKEKKKASPHEIVTVSNKQSPEYSKRPTTSIRKWETNKTFSSSSSSSSKEVAKEVSKEVPNLHKKLERK